MRKYVVALTISILMVLMLAMPVYAIADPDTPPAINAVYVYEDCLYEGDVGVLVEYYLDYAALPSESATESFIAVFIDTDGVTQLRAIAPYDFADNANDGYRRGLIWIYFTAAEVTAWGIDSANIALYEVWLSGNPTLAWAGDPPKTIAGIDYWQPAGTSTATLVALRVLYYAQELGRNWTLTLIEETALGNRLTSLGEEYFVNVIQGLRTIAPSAFSSGEYNPTLEDLDYSTAFGATFTDGTGSAFGSPITLTEGANSVPILVDGTFTVELTKGTVGTAETDAVTVDGSPQALVYGTNTITTTAGAPGNITVTVELENTTTQIEDDTVGTGLDLTTLATMFGMSRLMFSGMVWMLMSVVICAATYKVTDKHDGIPGAGKIVMLVFVICIIGGAVLGLLHPLVATLLFIGFGGLTGYVLFFRGANV